MTDARRIHEAFESGDLEGVSCALEDPSTFPNGWVPALRTCPLEYAIYHSPLPFIRTLIELGADPNYQDEGSFPSLLAALSTDREDRHQLLETLLAAGASLEQRGVNDYTPLHYAATRNDAAAVELLLARGADPSARTRIDDRTTPLEEAERLKCQEAVRALKRAPHRAGG